MDESCAQGQNHQRKSAPIKINQTSKLQLVAHQTNNGKKQTSSQHLQSHASTSLNILQHHLTAPPAKHPTKRDLPPPVSCQASGPLRGHGHHVEGLRGPQQVEEPRSIPRTWELCSVWKDRRTASGKRPLWRVEVRWRF